jgi:ubiquinone/menaquinone biosynthesis C-methylase UbiE
MFTHSARYYDHLYAFKDYAGAAAQITDFVRERRPNARTLLDVACGTGKHLESLQKDFEVEGLDLNPDLLAVARERLPDVPLHHADMVDFDLGRQFDVVACLFSSIAYVKTLDRMQRAVERMARHVAPGGLLLIEPWFSPETYWTGTITANFVNEPDLKIAWMYVSERRDNVSYLDIHYLVGEPSGVRSFNEVHEMGLFYPDEYREAILRTGMAHEMDERGFFGRGLHVGLSPADG